MNAMFPFQAIVGQERLKQALILNAINPALGGVLIRGHKGTAKSTAARGLAALLPEIEVIAGCPFSCRPGQPLPGCPTCSSTRGDSEQLTTLRRPMAFVELPLGATEDRLIGTLNLDEAIRAGKRRFEPGLLAHAHRGILYVDEVNLLEDHLVDVLLDAAAMGQNIVEREGISFTHPARFILIGTMNPEEGELRPQFLDRFALCVEVQGLDRPSDRAEIVRRRFQYEADPTAFRGRWSEQEEALTRAIAKAQDLLPSVACPDALLEQVAGMTVELAVQGHRADLALVKTACTLAAYHGRTTVGPDEIRQAAELVLPHRMRRTPFQEPQLRADDLQRCFDRQFGPTNPPSSEEPPPPSEPDEPDAKKKSGENPALTTFDIGETHAVRDLRPQPPRGLKSARGRKGSAREPSRSGRAVRDTLPLPGRPVPSRDFALAATICAAAPHQRERQARQPAGLAVRIEPPDVRRKLRRHKAATTILFVVDASGSMGARKRMIATKGAIDSLLLDAYQRRDRVGLIAFRGDRGNLLLPMTGSVERARQHLVQLPTGGRTPLAHGLILARDVMGQDALRRPDSNRLLVLISDGHANVPLDGSSTPLDDALAAAHAIRKEEILALAIDTETGPVRFNTMTRLAEALGGRRVQLEELRAESIAQSVRCTLQRV